LYAQSLYPISDDGSGAAGCIREKLDLAAATLAEAAGWGVLTAAYASCLPSPETCVPAVLAAQAALAALDIVLGEAIADYYACTHPASDPDPTYGGGGGGGGGGGSGTCDVYIVEVSYDGGISWNYYDTLFAC
jgi:hypothetical protein